MSDAERLDWLELHHTLHFKVDFLYVVDGFEAELTYDENKIVSVKADTLREAIDDLSIRVKSAGGMDVIRSRL